jgi:hypothetical protein
MRSTSRPSASGLRGLRTHVALTRAPNIRSCRVSGVARSAGLRLVAWLSGKETACLVEEVLALAEQEEHVATAEELDLRAGDARVHLFG